VNAVKVLMKKPMQDWKIVTIENSLEAMQNAVDDWIETITFDSQLVAICGETGRLKGLPHCCTIAGVEFVGTVMIAGFKDAEFTDVPISMELFKKVWVDNE
jgi:hypothetical protein